MDDPDADGLGHRSADDEDGGEIEKRCPHHRETGGEDPGGDYCGNGIGGVVKTVDEVESQGDDNEENYESE